MVIAITVFLCVYCAGAIVDATGSFVGPFLVSGCLIASGGLICLPARRIALWEHERNVRLRRQTRQNDYRWQPAQCLSKRRAVSLRVLSVVEFVYVTSMCRWILKCSPVVKKLELQRPPDAERISVIYLVVLTRHLSVMNRRTDRKTYIHLAT